MGLGASNLSIANLDVWQEAVTQIGQNIRGRAKNVSNNNTRISQSININNLDTAIYPCQLYTNEQKACENRCFNNESKTLYQCQFNFSDKRLENNITNSQNCNLVWQNTFEESIDDVNNICNGENETLTSQERENICIKRARRITCPTNNELEGITGQICYNDSECVNKCQFFNTNPQEIPRGYCTGPIGKFGSPTQEECQEGCDIGKTYIVRQYLGSNYDFQGESYPKYKYIYTQGGAAIDENPGFQPCLFSQENEDCQIELDAEDYYRCVTEEIGSNNAQNIDIDQCLEQCSISWKCPDSLAGQLPQRATLICIGGLCANNTSDVTIVLDQFSDSTVDAELTASITNNFQSTISKTINQTNKQLNFQQFNTSKELTEMTQSVKSSISNAISSDSENIEQSGNDIEQTITFTNSGLIFATASGCGDKINMDCMFNDNVPCGNCVKPPDNASQQQLDNYNKCNQDYLNSISSQSAQNSICTDATRTQECACKFNNETVLNYDIKQKAQSAITSIFNATVVNDLVSDYTLAVTQTNSGVNPFIFFIIIIAAIGAAAIVLCSLTYAFTKVTSTAGKLAIAFAGVALVGVIGYVAYYFANKNKNESEQQNAVEETAQIGCGNSQNVTCEYSLSPDGTELEDCIPASSGEIECKLDCDNKDVDCTKPDSEGNPQPDKVKNKFSPGAIAGITIGAIAIFVGTVLIMIQITKPELLRIKKNSTISSTNSSTTIKPTISSSSL